MFTCQPAAEDGGYDWSVPDTVFYKHTINVTRRLHDTFFSCHMSRYAKWPISGSTENCMNATTGSYHFQWKSGPTNVTCK